MRYSSRPRTTRSAETVRQAVREQIKKSETGRLIPDEIARDVVRELGVTDIWSAEAQATRQQVSRALDTLAVKGELVKYGRKDPKPGIHDRSNQVYYYTPEGDKRAKAEKAAKKVADAELRERWTVIHDMLTDAGFTPRSLRMYDRNEPAPRGTNDLHLSIEDWERFFAIEPGNT